MYWRTCSLPQVTVKPHTIKRKTVELEFIHFVKVFKRLFLNKLCLSVVYYVTIMKIVWNSFMI